MRHHDYLPARRDANRSVSRRGNYSTLSRQSSILITLAVIATLGILLSACAGVIEITATPVPPTLSPTPRSTPLPTVQTQVPFGSADRPYQLLIVPPPESTATGKSLSDFLKDNITAPFTVQIATNYGDVLAALCGATPSVAWADGWTILRALAQGCATPVLKIKRGDATGVASDLLVSSAANIKTMDGLRTSAKSRDYCRVSPQDEVSWILPALLMRTTKGFEPLRDFRSIKDIPDVQATIKEVVFNRCVTAIPTGTLDQFKVSDVADVTKVIGILGTTPELPYGALLVSSSFPKDVADQLVKLFTDNPDKLQDYVTADSFLKANAADFADFQKFVESAGINLAVSGQGVPMPSSALNPGQPSQ